MTVTRTEHDGDPWVAKWTAPNGSIYELYEADVALLRKVAAGKVEVHSDFPKWVYIDNSRHTVRDPATKTFRRLVDLGIVVAGEPEHHTPARAGSFSSAGTGYDCTTYRLADTAEATLAAVR